MTTKQTEQILKQDPPKLDECTNKEKLQVLSKYHALLHDVHKAMFNETRSELSASVALTLADDTSPAPAAIPYDSEAWKRVFLLENTIVRGVDTINSDDKGRLFSVSSDLLDNKLSDVSDEALIVSVESSEAAPGVDITLHDVLSSGPRNPLISDNSAAKRVYDTLVVESILFEMMFRIESVEITAAPRTDSESSNTSGSAEVIVRSIDEEYDSTRHIILDGMNMKYEVLPPSANNNYGNLHTSIIYDCQVADFLNGTTHFAANNSCSNRSISEKPQMKTVLKEGDFLSGFVFDSFEKSMQLEEGKLQQL